MPESSSDPDLTVTSASQGYLCRLAGLYPAVARLALSPSGWSVALVGVRFDAAPELVAAGLADASAAIAAAGAALRRVRDMAARESGRYTWQPGGPNRWYRDQTARPPAVPHGGLPDLSGADAAFRARLPGAVLGYLDAVFPALVNLAQHLPHTDPARGRTTDPNEHTAEVLALLDTGELAPRLGFIARVAVLYHDIGKGRDSYDPAHPQESARLAAPLLAQHGLTPEERDSILLHIREHDLLGVLSRGRMTHDEAIERLRLREEPANLAIHFAIATADISAIRGLRWVVEEGLIARARAELVDALARRE